MQKSSAATDWFEKHFFKSLKCTVAHFLLAWKFLQCCTFQASTVGGIEKILMLLPNFKCRKMVSEIKGVQFKKLFFSKKLNFWQKMVDIDPFSGRCRAMRIGPWSTPRYEKLSTDYSESAKTVFEPIRCIFTSF